VGKSGNELENKKGDFYGFFFFFYLPVVYCFLNFLLAVAPRELVRLLVAASDNSSEIA